MLESLTITCIYVIFVKINLLIKKKVVPLRADLQIVFINSIKIQ